MSTPTQMTNESLLKWMSEITNIVDDLDERLSRFEGAAKPTPLAFPTIEPDLLHAELQAWAASKKEAQ